jgi:hypothetical protein
MSTTQTGSTDPFSSILGVIRKMIPFSHSPWRTGQKDGRGQQLLALFNNANTDTSFTLALGHVPEQYVEQQKSVAGVVYNGSNQGTDWTPTKIVLRASAAGTYRLWIA